ncbi:MAG: cell division protein FtsZ [Albidovulum sp.]|nr:cell division protein FtsZ [Albidovulum sp.]
MTISTLRIPEQENFEPKIVVFGVGGAGCNAVNNMLAKNLKGAIFVVGNTDAQSLEHSNSEDKIQLGKQTTKGLGAGSDPAIGSKAADESREEIESCLENSDMCFVTAGMGGGTGTGAAPVIAKIARDKGILTVGVVTKPFQFEGSKRMKIAERGIEELKANVNTLIIVPNDNLFMVTKEDTTIKEAFEKADEVLYDGVKGITDLIVNPGIINLDFADVKAIMREMGNAMMGSGESNGDRKKRASVAAHEAMQNRLLGYTNLKDAKGILINVIGGPDQTLFDLDVAASTIRENVDEDANVIVGSSLDMELEGKIRVSIVATGIGPANFGEATTEGFADDVLADFGERQEIAASQPAPEREIHEVYSDEFPEMETGSGVSFSERPVEAAEEDQMQDGAFGKQDGESDEWDSMRESQEFPDAVQDGDRKFFESAAPEPAPENRYREFVAPKPLQASASRPTELVDNDMDWTLNQEGSDMPEKKAKQSASLKIAGFLKKFADGSSQANSSKGGVRAVQPSIRTNSADSEFDELRDVPAFARRQAN